MLRLLAGHLIFYFCVFKISSLRTPTMLQSFYVTVFLLNGSLPFCCSVIAILFTLGYSVTDLYVSRLVLLVFCGVS